MPLTTSQITGRVVLPDNTAFTDGVLTFTLSGVDTELAQVLPAAGYEITLDGDAMPTGAVLWRNTEGFTGSHYTVSLAATITRDIGGGQVLTLRKQYPLGSVQVGDSASYSIGELLRLPVGDAAEWARQVRFHATRGNFVDEASYTTYSVGTVVDCEGLSYRYTGAGTAIGDLPGWVAVGPYQPGHHNAAGDGVTNDTAAIYAWLMAGGGEAMDPAKVYMIDPMIITAAIKVRSRATFKQRSGWADWTAVTGMIECRADTAWQGFRGDGNRDAPSVNAGMTAILGTNPSNIITNKYKACLHVAALSGTVVVDLDDMRATNAIGPAFNLTAANGAAISGRIGTISVENSAAVLRMDRCQNLPVGSVYGYNIDNRIGGNNEYFFPFNNNAVMNLRAVNCPIEKVTILKHRGRPGGWFPASDLFITSVTMSSCVNSPMRDIEIRDVLLPMVAASDTSGDTIASKTANLGFSDVSNIGCEFDRLYVSGTFTQGWECMPGKSASYGDVVLRSNHGEQGTSSGSVGLNAHGGQRYAYNAGTGRTARRYPAYVASMDVEGFHYGSRIRANQFTFGNYRAHGNRADGALVSNIGAIEWGGGPEEVPSLVIINADIRFNGGNGVRVVNGGEIRVDAGRVADNCQMSGYDDPTLSGVAFTRTQGIYYDSADANADVVSKIIIGDVDTDSIPSYSFPTTGASYLARTPEIGSSVTIPDARVSVMAMTFNDLLLVNIGQRFQIQNVNAAGSQDVDIWVRDIIGNAVLAEVSTAYTGEWSDAVQTIALTGAWTIAAGANTATSTGGVLWSEMPFPAFIKTTGGYILLENQPTTDTMTIQSDLTWGSTFERTLTTAITGGAISYLQTGFSYTQRQTVRAAITHANVATDEDRRVDLVSGNQSVAVHNIAIGGFLNLGPRVFHGIVGDEITATATRILLGTEGGAASDNLRVINGLSDGDVVILSTASATEDVVLKQRVSGTDNMLLQGAADVTLSHSNDTVTLMFRGSDSRLLQLTPLADLGV